MIGNGNCEDLGSMSLNADFFPQFAYLHIFLKKKIVWGKKKANKKQTLLDGYYNEEEISIVPMEVWEEDSLLLGRLSS